MMGGARREGLREGLREGMREGRREGSNERALSIARNLLKTSLPIEQIVTTTGLTREEVEALRAQN
jgi:predicted transposase/invertase (TIGR01784 family)